MPDIVVNKEDKSINIAIILYVKSDDIDNYEWYLKFWKQQNINLYFVIDKCDNQQNLKDKLEVDCSNNCIINNTDEIDTKKIEWLLETDFSSYLTSNFLQNISLGDIITFIDQQGYTEIHFREEESFNNYFTLTNNIKSVKKSHITNHQTYPILLKKIIFLNKEKPYMLIDSLQNRYLYLGDILSEDLTYFNVVNKDMIIKEEELKTKENEIKRLGALLSEYWEKYKHFEWLSSQKEEELKTKENEIKRLGTLLSEYWEKYKHFEWLSSQKEEELNMIKKENENLNKKINNTKNSVAWKIFSPLLRIRKSIGIYDEII